MTIDSNGEDDDIWYENPEGKLLEGWTYIPLYTSPPQRQLKLAEHEHAIYCRGVEDGKAQRQPLTDEQIVRIACTPAGEQATTKGYVIPFARAIEAAHGIKGEA